MAASSHPRNHGTPHGKAGLGSVSGIHWWPLLLLLCYAPSRAGSPKDSQLPQSSTASAQLNPNKTFNLSLLKSGGTPANSGKSFATSPAPSFLTPKFDAKPSTSLNRSYDTKPFSSSEFITGEATVGAKAFATRKSASVETASESGSAPFLSKTDQSHVPKTPSIAIPQTPSSLTQTFEGSEAQKKKIPYTPGNGPTGGVTFGRVLSIEEVKEILNKSK